MLDRGFKMLQNTKWCLPIETWCLIFGIFNAVLSGLAVLALSLAHSWVTYVTGDDLYERISRHPDAVDDMLIVDLDDAHVQQQRILGLLTTITAVMFLFIWFLTSFIFSVFLCYGTHKKRPGFVKAYLIYGKVVLALMMIGAFVYTGLTVDFLGGSLILFACGFYSLLLMMVQRGHEAIRAAQVIDRALLLPGPEPCVKAAILSL